VARQARVEAESMRTDAERREEIRLLRQELKEDVLAVEELTDQAMKRVAAIEEKVGR
jgi:hypothetical protein